jgi:hypothetical protein
MVEIKPNWKKQVTGDRPWKDTPYHQPLPLPAHELSISVAVHHDALPHHSPTVMGLSTSEIISQNESLLLLSCSLRP